MPTQDGSICGNTKNETGYIKLANKKDSHYFYWFFESQRSPSEDPLLIWLTGGPGGSSLYALFMENGPCKIQPDLSTTINPYVWTSQANVIWLDQPSGVGFSYFTAPEDKDVNGANVGENMYWFLQGFIEKHPEFENRAFFIVGESYGGHFVPSAAHYVWQQSMLGDAQAGTKKINLQGIGIGNGWVDPDTQYMYAEAMATDNAYNVTFLTEAQIVQMKKDNLVCVAMSQACRANPLNGSVCMDEQTFSWEKHIVPYLAAGRNPYDIRESCHTETDPLCEGDNHLEEFLNLESVHKALNANKKWEQVSEDVSVDFIKFGDNAQPSHLQVADLLNDGVRVLVYNGDADLMCNWQSSEAWTKVLEWMGKRGFNTALEKQFVSHDPLNAGSSPVNGGVVRSFDNFAFLRVFNSGHMVPKNQPAVSLDMINRFFANEAL
uniref:Carboxypeptidase n=1 Tax=Globisporangium ultimum (strain ATCC 200006 / CBS 805.95 / DAOM BR144) TaxID=431595 RepID=K3X2E9_GLOUD